MAFAAFGASSDADAPAPRRAPAAQRRAVPAAARRRLPRAVLPRAAASRSIITSFQAPDPVNFDIGQYDYAFKWENYATVLVDVLADHPALVRSTPPSRPFSRC